MMSVLGLNSGYTVKNNHLLSGTPSGNGLYLTELYLTSSRPNIVTVQILVDLLYTVQFRLISLQS